MDGWRHAGDKKGDPIAATPAARAGVSHRGVEVRACGGIGRFVSSLRSEHCGLRKSGSRGKRGEGREGRMLRYFVLALMLAGCSTPSPPPTVEPPLRLAAWNIEHLAEDGATGCRPRTEAEYAALRAYVDNLNADVVAFQEVESAAAARRVFDPARYEIVIEDRPGSARRAQCYGRAGQFLNRQATGFAIRRGVPFERLPDQTALQLGDPDLRSGVDVLLRPPGQAPIRLLAVHLKSGCPAGATAEACATLLRQIPVLEAWIDARAAAGERFAVLGDFNRRLALADDQIWTDLNDGQPAPIALAAGRQGPACNPRFNSFIDHVITADTGAAMGFREWVFEGEKRLSDHCAISVDLTGR